jgi:LacI family transcriptional regulator
MARPLRPEPSEVGQASMQPAQPGEAGPGMARPGAARLDDVARRAGVSLATVDRVLNERGGVSPRATRRVIEAARALGLRRLLPAPHRRHLRLDIMLTESTTPFLARLTQTFIDIGATLDRAVILQRSRLNAARPEAIASRLRDSAADGILIYCEEHPAILAALQEIGERGVPVICVTTDLPSVPRLAYVGIDHHKAGRTAAFIVLIVATSLGFRAHRQRVEGFAEALRAQAPHLAIRPVLQGHDDHDRVYLMLRQALDPGAPWAALYNTGGANRAVAAALRDQGLARRVVFIGHELTPDSAGLLREGLMTLTIDQAPELQARRAIDMMLHHLGIAEITPGSPEIPFTLHTPENL